MITGYCRTNLDDLKRVEWPREFVAVPRVGEWVQSLDGKARARVASVTHVRVSGADAYRTPRPAIEVELHR